MAKRRQKKITYSWSLFVCVKQKTSTQWKATAFTGDQTGDQAAKFRRLMGIKHGEAGASGEGAAGVEVTGGQQGDEELTRLSEEQQRKQNELFQHLDTQYEFARMATHTHRGIGLGFASHGLPDQPVNNSDSQPPSQPK